MVAVRAASPLQGRLAPDHPARELNIDLFLGALETTCAAGHTHE
jgi:hypothetical protein